MAQNVVIDTEEFVSSKRASQITGYAQDYIGQLARGGDIEARRIGGLWHVSLASLRAYKDAPREPEEKIANVSADESVVEDTDTFISPEGIEFISASRASKLTGYHQDYVGQLARGAKILSRQIGNRWYIGKDSLIAHKRQKDALFAAVQAQAVGIRKGTTPPEEDIKRTYEIPLLTYLNDTGDLMPDTPGKALAERYWGDDESRVVPIHITKSFSSLSGQGRRVRSIPGASFKELQVSLNANTVEYDENADTADAGIDRQHEPTAVESNRMSLGGKSIFIGTSVVFAILTLFIGGTFAFGAIFRSGDMLASAPQGAPAAAAVPLEDVPKFHFGNNNVFDKVLTFFENMLTTEVTYRRSR